MILGILERNYHSGECSSTHTPPNRRTNIIVGWVSQPCPHSRLLTEWQGWKGLCFMRFFVFLVMLHASLFVENCWLLRKKLMDKMLRQPCWVGWFWGFQRVCVFFIERRSSTTWKILVTAEPQGKGGGGSKKKIERLGGMVWKHETCKLAHDQGWWVVGANFPHVNSVRRSIGSIMWQMALMAKNLAGFPMTQRHQRKWRTFTSNIWTMTRWDWFHGFMVNGPVASHDARMQARTSIPYPSLMEREWLFNHLADECMQYWYKSIPDWRNLAPVWRVRFLQL